MFLKMQAAFQWRLADLLGDVAVPDGRLPAGRHALTREVVLASQRGRLLDAMAQAVADHGYGACTVAHVVTRAEVSRKTFYEHFSDKEACFLALYDTGIAYVLGRIAETISDASVAAHPRERVAAGLRTFLAVLAEEPAFCRTIVIEVHAAGAEALRRRRAVIEVFAQRYEDINAELRAADDSIAPLPHDAALALIGAILELVAIRVGDGRIAELPGLADLLTDFVLRHVAAGAARHR
jgi:AcrR family transcriptional regulator